MTPPVRMPASPRALDLDACLAATTKQPLRWGRDVAASFPAHHHLLA